MGSIKELEFRCIFYDVKNSNESISNEYIRLVNGVSGVIRPGRLTALMGSSGSGKTSFINSLVGNVEPSAKTSGKVLYSGEPRDPRKWFYQCSYLEQKNTYLEYLTVEETLTFYGKCRNPKNLQLRLTSVLSDLDLVGVRNTVMKNLSGGEVKRVCLAIELLNEPDILVLDEPTSGLDSHLALSLVAVLKSYAESGRIVLVTIHQPGKAILSLFDDLLFIIRGSLFYSGKTWRLKSFLLENGMHKPKSMSTIEFLFELQSSKDGFLKDQMTLSCEQGKINNANSGCFFENSSVNRNATLVMGNRRGDVASNIIRKYKTKVEEIIEKRRAKGSLEDSQMCKDNHIFINCGFSLQHVFLLLRRQLVHDFRSRRLPIVFLVKMVLILLVFLYNHEDAVYRLKESNRDNVINSSGGAFSIESCLNSIEKETLVPLFFAIDYMLITFLAIFSTFEDAGFVFSDKESVYYSQISIYFANLLYDSFFCILRSSFTVFLFWCSDLHAIIDGWFFILLFLGPLFVVVSVLFWKCLITDFYALSVVRCIVFILVSFLRPPSLSEILMIFDRRYSWFKYFWPLTYFLYLFPYYFVDSVFFFTSFDEFIKRDRGRYGVLLFISVFNYKPNFERSFIEILSWFNKMKFTKSGLYTLTASSTVFVIALSQLLLLILRRPLLRTRLEK